MAVVEEPLPATDVPKATPHARPLHKRVMHWVRRLHLYFGLFLFPWAILYGVTAFLFNHPSVFPDQPLATFGAEVTAGTPLESLPTPAEQAAAVVTALNEKQKPEVPYRLGSEEAHYATRDFIFANVKTTESRTFTILYRVKVAAARSEKRPSNRQTRPNRRSPLASPPHARE